MRILVSAYACNPLGAKDLHPGEDLTGWRLVNEIARRHDVTVISHAYNRPGVQAAAALKSPVGVTFRFLELPSPFDRLYKVEFGQRIYYYLWQIAAYRLARSLHEENPFDLAHHVTFGNDWLASYIGAFLPAPYVHGPVGGGQRTPTPLRSEYTAYGKFAERAREKAQWFGRRDVVRNRCLRRAKAILVCNRETRAKMPRAFDPKIFDFPVNGMSREDLAVLPVSPPPGDGVFRILSAGRFHRLKGFALAVKAFGLFLRDHPASEFILVGQGEEGGRIREAVRRLGIDGQVRLVEWVPRRDLLGLMAESDILVFPSFRDGGGAVVVEAMAMGKPVVVIDSGGPGFHVRPDWGSKIRPGPAETVAADMAAAFARLHDNPALRREMGRAARSRVEEYYLNEKQGERLEAIYGFALGERERP
ncbi:MAG: glycosyltransferase [Candidatus Aminicenantes bacterium]|nr:glycosyltransferase [Candidatus Aminicenantes bacterium]